MLAHAFLCEDRLIPGSSNAVTNAVLRHHCPSRLRAFCSVLVTSSSESADQPITIKRAKAFIQSCSPPIRS